MSKEVLGPLDIGMSHLPHQAERIISEHPYVKLLTDPRWDGEHWRALANVEGMLCIVAVNPTRPKELDCRTFSGSPMVPHPHQIP